MTSESYVPENSASRYRLSTETFAKQHLVESQTVRKQFSATGSYHGIRPVRLPNRRLLWPSDVVENLLKSQQGVGL